MWSSITPHEPIETGRRAVESHRLITSSFALGPLGLPEPPRLLHHSAATRLELLEKLGLHPLGVAAAGQAEHSRLHPPPERTEHSGAGRGVVGAGRGCAHGVQTASQGVPTARRGQQSVFQPRLGCGVRAAELGARLFCCRIELKDWERACV